jgi:hypothetical protein
MALANYDPKNIKKVKIDEVEVNDYNPKAKETKEYQNVVKSLRINGLQQPIMVRELNGKYVIVDGEQRYTAAKELGFEEIYIYNFGEISDEDAKATTIWMEVQVPFDQIDLAPIALELHEQGFELPFTDLQLDDFKHIAEFDFDSYVAEDNLPVKNDNSEKTYQIKIKLSKEQLDEINEAIKGMVEGENIGEAHALELLVAMGYEKYQAENYTPENTDINEL